VSGQLQAPAALSPGKELRYPFDRRLDGLHSKSGRGGEEKIFLDCSSRESKTARPTRNIVTVLGELLRSISTVVTREINQWGRTE
jgi:hypothetical protein